MSEQLSLLRPRTSTSRASRASRAEPPPAADRPVARVAVDVPLAHLDRPFDYLVPATMDAAAVPGVRVRVRFAGRLVGGFLLERTDASEHAGGLAQLHAVVSPEPVLSPEVAALARAVADRYAGTLADVLRLAVPPRHARAEGAEPAPAPARPPAPDPGEWAEYDGGPALLRALASGVPARAVWSALPGSNWPDALARAVATVVAAGRGALVVVPDRRDVDRVAGALLTLLGPDGSVALTADLGPAQRYRRWLAVRRGSVRAVVGTRAAMFAPVHDLGLAVVWDDGDDLHAEPHAPYPHVRTVLSLRSSREGAALLVGGFTRTAEGAGLVGSGWAHAVAGSRDRVRRAAPAMRVAGADDELADDPGAQRARLPTVAWRAAQQALRTGPVLVQVPRSGYLPGIACARCLETARCPRCSGPLASAATGDPPACSWCGVAATRWECPRCGSTRARARVVGATRTAEELGRAFPRHQVRSSGGSSVLDRVNAEPALVVATPGAEPVAEGGYAAALLLDGWRLLARADLRVGEEALRRWMTAAALVRPASAGGQVVLMAESSHPAVQALVRWDPATFADRELAERTALRLPPAVRLATLSGEPAAVHDFLEVAELPPGAEVLGPTGEDPERVLVRVARTAGAGLAAALRAAAATRSAHKSAGAVRVQVDPVEVG